MIFDIIELIFSIIGMIVSFYGLVILIDIIQKWKWSIDNMKDDIKELKEKVNNK